MFVLVVETVGVLAVGEDEVVEVVGVGVVVERNFVWKLGLNVLNLSVGEGFDGGCFLIANPVKLFFLLKLHVFLLLVAQTFVKKLFVSFFSGMSFF